jgi:hypothetical protein
VIFRQSNGAVEAEIEAAKPTALRNDAPGDQQVRRNSLLRSLNPALVTNLSEKSGVIKAECVVKREKRTFDDVSAACQASTLPKFWASLP